MLGTSWRICFPISCVLSHWFSVLKTAAPGRAHRQTLAAFLCVCISLLCSKIQLEMTASVPLPVDEQFWFLVVEKISYVLGIK